jgi:hypothetical protein
VVAATSMPSAADVAAASTINARQPEEAPLLVPEVVVVVATSTPSTAGVAAAATNTARHLEETSQPGHVATPSALRVSEVVAASAASAADAAAASTSTARQLEEDAEEERKRQSDEAAHLAERTRQLEASAQRLRDNIDRLRFENRRARVLGPAAVADAAACTNFAEPSVTTAQAEAAAEEVLQAALDIPSASEESRRIQEMRRKIAELDKINELERQRLEEEQREVQERRRQQEAFERVLQERTERDMQERHAREQQAELERAEREEEQQREREGRERRRHQQLWEEEKRSKRREEQAKEGRSEAAQLRWNLFEEELERQWADQEAEERRRANLYAKERRRRSEEWDRRFASERQKFASEAEFREAARFQKARSAASADERFYGPRRVRGQDLGENSARKTPEPPRATCPPQRPQLLGAIDGSTATLTSEECAVLKELQSLRSASRDVQKARVKELLFRWHPDKNPTCQEKATRVFQFVQRQRELLLGL